MTPPKSWCLGCVWAREPQHSHLSPGWSPPTIQTRLNIWFLYISLCYEPFILLHQICKILSVLLHFLLCSQNGNKAVVYWVPPDFCIGFLFSASSAGDEGHGMRYWQSLSVGHQPWQAGFRFSGENVTPFNCKVATDKTLKCKWAPKNICDRFLAYAGSLFLQVGEYKKKCSSLSAAEWEDEMAAAPSCLASCPRLDCIKTGAGDFFDTDFRTPQNEKEASSQNTRPGFHRPVNPVPAPTHLGTRYVGRVSPAKCIPHLCGQETWAWGREEQRCH